jgi:hypothetical protein
MQYRGVSGNGQIAQGRARVEKSKTRSLWVGVAFGILSYITGPCRMWLVKLGS